MQAEIITIGDEILIGQITDTNSQWIAKELNKIGVSVYQITSIQDEKKHILQALFQAQKKSDIVILTGGLGPTNDDITKNTLKEYFKDTFVLNTEVFEGIKQMFAKINYPFTEINQKQALVPSKCTVLKNLVGTAPGMWFEENNKIVISLPGVPNEMKYLMEKAVLPKLQKHFTLPFIVHKTIITYGVGESVLAEKIAKWEKSLSHFIKLAYLPSYGSVRLRLSAKGNNKLVLKEEVHKQIDLLKVILKDVSISISENEAIEFIIGKLLKQENKTLAVAESCTGGNIAKMLTSVAGCSAYFKGGIIAYNEQIKIKELGVFPATLQQFTVVSAQVAKEMAVGVIEKFNTDYAIATTGNAGPTKDKTDKSVGTVFIAIATPEQTQVLEYNFGTPRQKVIQKASVKALELLKKQIEKSNANLFV